MRAAIARTIAAMPGLTAAIASIVHVGGFARAAAFGALRLVALRRQDVAATRFADNGNGIAALLLFGGGLWRLFGQLEKPLAFYSANPVFWVTWSTRATSAPRGTSAGCTHG